MKRLKTYLLAVFLLSLCLPFSGCEDADINLSPEEAEEVIIGKWKLIKIGLDEEHLEPVDDDRWIEFLQYKRIKNQTYKVEYNMDQECLYINYNSENMFIYEYKFTNKKNTLTLKLIHSNAYSLGRDISIYIYRRVK
ncbi:MAG: hypothetical protein LBG15_07270 [Dysgonamonadaceae bacterium]|jgi:hypothetical protein|nr:hypothetical protein [Dysgonamonadaceae bacterium]